MNFLLFRRSALVNVWDNWAMAQVFKSVISPARLFKLPFIGNGQLNATFGPAAGQHFAAIGSLHSLSETMHRFSAAVMGLKCTFHWKRISRLYLPFRSLRIFQAGCRKKTERKGRKIKSKSGHPGLKISNFVFRVTLGAFLGDWDSIEGTPWKVPQYPGKAPSFRSNLDMAGPHGLGEENGRLAVKKQGRIRG